MKYFKFETLYLIFSAVIAILLTILFYVAFVVGMAHIMVFFGFEYESIFSLLAYFLAIEFWSFPFEWVACKFTSSQEKVGNMSKITEMFMLSAFCVLINMTFLGLFSVVLSGIWASSLAVTVASLCLLPCSLLRTLME